MIDASSSMLSSMPSSRLAKGAPNDAMFFTTVGAARYFVELRMKGKYRDLLALVEFGDQAYVITPFTTDYENILFSMSLIGDWTEFMSVPRSGHGHRQRDRSERRPVPRVRCARCRRQRDGDLHRRHRRGGHRGWPERLRRAPRRDARQHSGVLHSRPACRAACQPASPTKPGRRRSREPAASSSTAPTKSPIIRAVQEIDRAAAGRVEMKRYTTEQPRFASFALIAAALWAWRC